MNKEEQQLAEGIHELSQIAEKIKTLSIAYGKAVVAALGEEREGALSDGHDAGYEEAKDELRPSPDGLRVLRPILTAAYEYEITRRPWAARIIQAHLDSLEG